MTKLTIPIPDSEIEQLKTGDVVTISGIMVTARDTAHKYMVENFIDGKTPDSEQDMLKELTETLDGSVIYHCGPIVKKTGEQWEFVAAGPTTSIREEPYEYKVIEKFNVKGIIGKGGMGPLTLKACREHKAVYLHAIGGAAALIAKSVKKVVGLYKEEFGLPEAFWKIEVEDFKAVVTMDAQGNSLHDKVQSNSKAKLDLLLKGN